MWGYSDGLLEIKISERKLYDLLKPRVGKRAAKAMAYSKHRVARWKQRALNDVIGGSQKLKDIRLLYLFLCPLTARQQVLLKDNLHKYKVVK